MTSLAHHTAKYHTVCFMQNVSDTVACVIVQMAQAGVICVSVCILYSIHV